MTSAEYKNAEDRSRQEYMNRPDIIARIVHSEAEAHAAGFAAGVEFGRAERRATDPHLTPEWADLELATVRLAEAAANWDLAVAAYKAIGGGR